MSPAMKDDLMYQVGGTLEAALLNKWGVPLLSNAPDMVVNS
jgi:aspartyl-tRNA(Asn)/glutamyl-tRNA(Gln) amidotransferase subunit A